MPLCYLDGVFLPLAEAKVSVLDRGFIFGDGVYEVIPVFGRRVLRLAEHLARLERSLAAVGIVNPLSHEQWTEILARLLDAHAGADFTVYVQLTRGVAPRLHQPPAGLPPTVFAMLNPLVPADPGIAVAAITHEDFRWQRCDIKSTSLLANVLLRQAAAAAGAAEAILVRDGLVTEGAASNVFVVADGRLRTPPLSQYLLPGITRDLLIELLAGGPDAVLETDITAAELRRADEIFLTSSGRELTPVSHLDGQSIGSTCPGPVFRRVVRRYAEFKTRA
ncbi:MAG TPA: D-amino acid aminotransferase [Gammaproteobacteria bacterium]|nr:D-amino acid aminotransferase [Gammaproteobacteria bacterium]